MIVFTDSEGRIKDVNTTSDSSLIEQEILDDEENPFTGWTVAKICCYKVQVNEGHVTMMTPYVDSRLIEHIDMLGNEAATAQATADENDAAIVELAEIVSEMEGKIDG